MKKLAVIAFFHRPVKMYITLQALAVFPSRNFTELASVTLASLK
jgi:hypothetical protein